MDEVVNPTAFSFTKVRNAIDLRNLPVFPSGASSRAISTQRFPSKRTVFLEFSRSSLLAFTKRPWMSRSGGRKVMDD
jgi:hypothetical protein